MPAVVRPEEETAPRMTPDNIFFDYDPVMTFILGDFNNDGNYEIIRGKADQTHEELERTLSYAMKNSLADSDLPVIQGRTGRDAYGLMVAFWKAGRTLMGGYGPTTDGREDDPAYFNQLIEKQTLPFLLQQKIITPETIWYDSQGNYRGLVVESTPQGSQDDPLYDVGGRSMTYMDVMTALHAGDARTRQQVTNFICQSTDRVFDQVRSRLMCGRQKPQPVQPRRVEIGPHHPRGVDFRSQKSLNRAWEAEMGRRLSRRARLARLLV